MENNAIQKQPGTLATPASPTAVTTAPRSRPALADEGPARPRPKGTARMFLQALASLRLTVVLFVLSFILVFYGTVAQIDNGVWTVVEQYFRSFIVFIPIQLNVQVAQVFFGVPSWVKIPGAIPFPAGWTLGGLLLINLLAAHALRFKLTWARGGVLLLHAGLILLLVGELLTGLYSQEGNMTLRNGEAANFVVDNRKVELAVVTPLEGDQDEVVVVPGSRLVRKDATISDEKLPFDIVVKKWMKNSGIANLGPNDASEATVGFGLKERAVERPEVSGTDPEQKADAPSAYVTLKKKGSGEEIGTYLVSTLYFDQNFHPMSQEVEVDGKKYDLALRFKRVYKPYTIQLLKFNHDLFPGTNKPKNFSSEIQLLYPEKGEDRRVEISMNNPLRLIVDWSGVVPQVDTLFQSSFLPGDAGTVLHVVDNRSWLMPYVSCTMVTVGMLWHFGLMIPTLLLRVRMASLAAPKAKGVSDPEGKTPAGRWVPWIPVAAVAVAALYFVGQALPPRDSSTGLHVQAFGRLPVQEGGRVQPFDSLARNTLMMLSDRQEFYEEKVEPGEAPKPEDDKEWVKRPAIVWLLDVMSSSIHSEERPYFQVTPDLANLIELPQKKDGELYSLVEITKAPGSKRLQSILLAAQKKDPEELQAIEKRAMNLVANIRRYQELGRYLTNHRVFRIENMEVQALLRLPRREGHRYSLAEFADSLGELQMANMEARKAEQKDKQKVTAYQMQVMKTWNKVGLYMGVATYSKLLLVPPLSDPTNEHWYSFETVPTEKLEEQVAGRIDSALHGYFYAKVPVTQDQGTKMFNEAVEKYHEELAAHPVPAAKAVGMEQHFNKMAPFYQCLIFYALAMVLVIVSWLLLLGGEGAAPVISTALQRSAFWIMVVTAVVHTVALGVRMYLQGRPPVTNLYSSAIFIGWGCVLLGLLLDVIYRTSLGTLVGSVLGFMTSIIAFHLASTGDTLEMMQAVLDTNLWLATHVTTVTLGYTATFVAGGMGIVYLAVWLFGEVNGKQPLRDVQKTLSTMIYGVVCFATLLSFVGTVLGGIWADQSWGRFWGWDPKENGAVLIVIWNALILHARWGGLVKSTGVAALTVVGNMITVWSWFGTNQLGVGLHAYGFSNTLALFCVLMWVSHALVLVAMTIPGILRLFEVLPPTKKA